MNREIITTSREHTHTSGHLKDRGARRAEQRSLNVALLKTGLRFWLMEILISGFNFFVLMNLVYEPRWGSLVAHQIGMSTRIVYIFILSYFLLRSVKSYVPRDLVHVGIMWLALTLVFEWGGSLLVGRPVSEIIVGWNMFGGYMWPYVLLSYLLSNLIIGAVIRPGRTATGSGR